MDLDRAGDGASELEEVVRRELALLDPAVRRAPERVRELLDPAFREVGASGRVWDREQIVAALAEEEDGPAVAASELDAREVAPGLVLLTWVSGAGSRRAHRTSLWRRTYGEWRMLHHQGTPAPHPPPSGPHPPSHR